MTGRSPFNVIRSDLVITPDNPETLRHLAIKATGWDADRVAGGVADDEAKEKCPLWTH
jgi:hypothetical protein